MARLLLDRVTIDYPIHRRGKPLLTNNRSPLGGSLFVDDDREYIRALDRVTVDVPDAQRMAIVGGNGSGKSTMLKTLAGILPIATGRREIEGRVATLFSTGIGMDGERSGRENIRRLAALHNIPRRDVPDIIADIDEFSELGEFLDLPISSYSSGMKARLGFAFTTGIKADILLIDEVIGVGDTKFYQKAQDRLKNQLHGAGIVVMASHAPSILNEFCQGAIVLKRGQVAFRGRVNDALAFYNSDAYRYFPGKPPEAEPVLSEDPVVS